MLEVKDLHVNYGAVHALNGISLHVDDGEIVSLIGANGAGKTTVFNMLTGVYKPTEGNIVLDGNDITGATPEAISKAGIARTFQNIRLWKSMTVFENVLVAKHMRARQNVFSATFRGNAKEEKRMRQRAGVP